MFFRPDSRPLNRNRTRNTLLLQELHQNCSPGTNREKTDSCALQSGLHYKCNTLSWHIIYTLCADVRTRIPSRKWISSSLWHSQHVISHSSLSFCSPVTTHWNYYWTDNLAAVQRQSDISTHLCWTRTLLDTHSVGYTLCWTHSCSRTGGVVAVKPTSHSFASF